MKCVGIGICTPPPSLPTQPPRKHSKLTPTTSRSRLVTCSVANKWAERLLGNFQFFTTTTTTAPDSSSDLHHSLSTVTYTPPPLAFPKRHVSIPLHFYKVLGAETHFLGDGIRRAYEARVSKPPQYGFSQDALINSRQILQAACETLADPQSRREYNQGLIDDKEDTAIA